MTVALLLISVAQLHIAKCSLPILNEVMKYFDVLH